MLTGGQCAVWRPADWRRECSAVVAAVCGMHRSEAEASASRTDSSLDDDCVQRLAAAAASLSHTTTYTGWPSYSEANLAGNI